MTKLNLQPVTKFLLEDHFQATANTIMTAGILGVRKLGAESFGLETMSIAIINVAGQATRDFVKFRRNSDQTQQPDITSNPTG